MLFEYRKKSLLDKQFAADVEVKRVVTSWLWTPHTNFFSAGMQAMVTTVGQMFKLNVYGTKGRSDGHHPLPCVHYTSESE